MFVVSAAESRGTLNILDSTDTKAPLTLKNLEFPRDSLRNFFHSINSKYTVNVIKNILPMDSK